MITLSLIKVLVLLLLANLTCSWPPDHKATRRQNSVSRFTKETNCPPMKISTTCKFFKYYVWDETGPLIAFDSSEGKEFSICYDPSICYVIEIISETDDCNYEAFIDGLKVADGTVKYVLTLDLGATFRIGNCKPRCSGETELIMKAATVNLSYKFYRVGTQNREEDIIPKRSIKSICMNASKCNIFTNINSVFATYSLLQNNVNYDYGFLYTSITFGKCRNNCEDVAVLISNDSSDPFHYSLTKNERLEHKGQLSPGSDKLICMKEKECYLFDTNGNATYFFFKNDELYDFGVSEDYTHVGACSNLCDSMPVLSNTERGRDIVTNVATISGLSPIVDVKTSRYRAA